MGQPLQELGDVLGGRGVAEEGIGTHRNLAQLLILLLDPIHGPQPRHARADHAAGYGQQAAKLRA